MIRLGPDGMDGVLTGAVTFFESASHAWGWTALSDWLRYPGSTRLAGVRVDPDADIIADFEAAARRLLEESAVKPTSIEGTFSNDLPFSLKKDGGTGGN